MLTPGVCVPPGPGTVTGADCPDDGARFDDEDGVKNDEIDFRSWEPTPPKPVPLGPGTVAVTGLCVSGEAVLIIGEGTVELALAVGTMVCKEGRGALAMAGLVV